MKNFKFWRTALSVALALTVMLSITGGTIAWFTDSVTSEGNIIKSGTLDVELAWRERNETEEEDWKDASTGAIFNYDKWEPGYTDVKQVKVTNAGSLAFKFNLFIDPDDAAEDAVKLADVIDVYVGTGTVPASFEDVLSSASNKDVVASITEIMNDSDGAAHGVLLPEGESADGLPSGEVEMWIALHMQESAGNEYQNLSLGNGFTVKLHASQYTYEEDSFGSDYDAQAHASTVYVWTPDELKDALKLGANVVLMDDITIDKGIVPADGTILNLNGHTITDSSTGGRAIGVQKGASLTVNGDGGVTKDPSVASEYAMPFYVSNGTLTVNGGTYNMGAPSGKDYNILLQNTSKMVINGGTFTNTANYPLINVIYSSTLEINGGFFESIGTANPDLFDIEYNATRISTITFKGGTYVNYDPSKDNESGDRVKLADGYEVLSETKDNGDVWYTVVPMGADGLLGSEEELKDALEKGGQYVFTSDLELSGEVKADEDVEFILNGNTLTVDKLEVGADVTLSNGTLKHGDIEYKDEYGFDYEGQSAVYVGSGKLTLDNVNLDAHVPCTLKINNNSSIEIVGIHVNGGECVISDSEIVVKSEKVYGNLIQYETLIGACVDSGSLTMNNSKIIFDGFGGRDSTEYLGMVLRTDKAKTVTLNNTSIENALLYAVSTGSNAEVYTTDDEAKWNEKYAGNLNIHYSQP